MPKQKITTFLWFKGDAQKAVKFYTAIFPNSKITTLSELDKWVSEARKNRFSSSHGIRIERTEMTESRINIQFVADWNAISTDRKPLKLKTRQNWTLEDNLDSEFPKIVKIEASVL